MNEQKVTEVVNNIILDRITQLVEDMSNQDFIEFVMDRLEEEGVEIDTENDDVVEKIKDVVGVRMIPLLHKLSEFIINKTIPRVGFELKV
jgi:hypothetical protein